MVNIGTKPKRRLGSSSSEGLPDFDAVLPMTRRAQVAETLRSAILSGHLAPGTQLVELKLASRFGVSRSSIREAIWELVDQGLVENRPYAGAFVRRIDEETMAEVFSLRGAIERYCFEQLWPKRSSHFNAEFAARHKALVKAFHTNKKNTDALEAEMRFHSFPYEFSGNQTLLDVWHQLSKKIQLGFVMGQDYVPSAQLIENSQRYYELAIGDDLNAMLKEIDRHLELGIEAIRRIVAERALNSSKKG